MVGEGCGSSPVGSGLGATVGLGVGSTVGTGVAGSSGSAVGPTVGVGVAAAVGDHALTALAEKGRNQEERDAKRKNILCSLLRNQKSAFLLALTVGNDT